MGSFHAIKQWFENFKQQIGLHKMKKTGVSASA
jgi:hypothetical protein